MTDLTRGRSREKTWQALRVKLEGNAASLIRQGVLIAKQTAAGRLVWAVRFVVTLEEGRKVHRSIYVGTDRILLKKTRDLLQHYRSLADLPKQLTAWSRMLGAACSTVKRMLRRSPHGAKKSLS
jgi:hypothetical protein